MNRHAIAALLLLALLSAAPLRAADTATPELEEVRVEDEPGPLMWRVSKDGHVLWIIGTLSPLPRDLKWNTRQLEAVVKESGEVLAATNFNGTVDGGNWAVIRSLPALIRLRKNPDEAQLVDLLTPEQYARWRRLAAATGEEPDEDAEQWRPMLLADSLYYQTLKAQGLGERNVVAPKLERIAKEARVPVRRRKVDVPLGKPKKLIEEFRTLPRERELECLVSTMDFIEAELPQARERAHAWATGDQSLLTKDLSALTRESCTLASLRESSLKARLEELEAEVRQDFLDTAGYALLGREVSVTTLPIQFIAGPRSLLDDLRASGYTVETPYAGQPAR